MNSAFASLGKNLLLIALVIVSVFNFFYGWFSFHDLLSIQILVGLVYVFLSCYEYLNASYMANVPMQRYAYYPYRFFVFSVLKIGAYLLCAGVLWRAGSRIQYLYPICIIIALTELVIMALRYKKRLCFVSVYANYVFVSQTRQSKVFASEIERIEYRHHILYLVKKNKTTFSFKIEEIENGTQFLNVMREWLYRNGVTISNEAKEKLGI